MLERLEHPGRLRIRHPDSAVFHFDEQVAIEIVASAAHSRLNVAALGKFQCVPDQVQHDLPQSTGVANEVSRQLGRKIEQKLPIFRPRDRRQKFHHLFEHRRQVETLLR